MAGALGALGLAGRAAAAGPAALPDVADLRDAALRGLARASNSGDPVLAEQAAAAALKLEGSDPEGSLLMRIYRIYDAASPIYGQGSYADRAAAADLVTLHRAVHDRRAVSFSYTALNGDVTTRTVLPLALVHPPQGIKLLAWCEARQDCRQFFVRAISCLTPGSAQFADRRLGLLRRLADSTGRT